MSSHRNARKLRHNLRKGQAEWARQSGQLSGGDALGREPAGYSIV